MMTGCITVKPGKSAVRIVMQPDLNRVHPPPETASMICANVDVAGLVQAAGNSHLFRKNSHLFCRATLPAAALPTLPGCSR